MSARLKALLALLGLLCLVALVNYMEGYFRPVRPKFAIGSHSHMEEHVEEEAAKRRETGPQEASPLPPEFQKPVVKMGNPSAPVKVKAYLMSLGHCHRPTLDALREVAKKFSGSVYVEIVNMETPKGQEIASKDKVHCVSVFINERKEFELSGPGGKKRKVELSGMVGGTFTPEDIGEIVRREVARSGGGKSVKKECGSPCPHEATCICH